MGNSVVLDRLDRFCCPVSQFIERNVTCSDCTCSLTPPTGNGTAPGETILTLCFQDTVVLYIILGLFWFLSGLKVCRKSKRKAVVPVNWLNITKIVVCGLLILPPVVDLLYTIVMATQQKVAYFLFLSPVMLALSMGLAGFITYYERVRGVHSSALMSVLWMSLVGYGAMKLFTLSLQASQLGIANLPDKFRFGSFIVELVLFLLQLALSFVSEKKSPHRQYSLFTEEGREPCPEESSSFYSRLTWWWLNKIVWIGWRRSLTYDDLYDLNYEDKSEVVSERFYKEWEKELKKANISFYHQHDEGASDPEVLVKRPQRCCGKAYKPSLVMAMARTFFSTFAMAGLFKLLQDLLQFATPIILKLIIQYTHDSEPAWKGYFYAILMFSVAVGQSLFLHQYFHRGFLVGMRVRTAILSTVYKKALRLSNRARRSRTVGEIVNLMSVDAQRIMDFAPYAHSLWSAVFQIVGSLILLYQTIGWSVLAGFFIMVIMIPINMVMASFNRKFQIKQMAQKDKRTKLVNEVLNGIKVIKLYAWEIPFKRLISQLRLEELKQFKYSAYIGSGMSFFFTCSPFMVALATFATYAIATKDSTNPDDRLTADRAFVALSLFNILRFPLLMLPNLISMLVQVNVSVKRLREFLMGEELDPENIDWREEPAVEDDSVTVSDGTFTWDTTERPNLNDINLHIKPGELVAVVGHVGAGKSSLISALLGEMEKMNGHVALRGSVAYVPQVAWIQNAKLKDNVLFGKILNEPLYKKTLQECALESDLEILPGGDMTEIGEKGINLSGGQKQRVSLARAVYQETDIYLLDDPLSAVDSHVGKHIFDKVIGPDGMLRGKVRILVTHGLGFLPQCDRIVVMDDGKITESGAYSELMDNNGAFAEFIRHYSTMEDNEEGDPSSLEDQAPDGSKLAGGLAADSPAVIKRRLKKSVSTEEEKEEEKKLEGKRRASELMTEETVKTGTVRPSVILAYCKACTYHVSILVLLLYLLQNVASVGNNFWLAEWTNENSNNPNNTKLPLYLGVYTVLGFAQAFFVLAAAFSLTYAGIKASIHLHDSMLNNIVRSPMSFFDTTPMGRILNRFSKDIYYIDEVIPRALQSFLMTFISCIGTLLVIVIASPWFLIVAIPVLVVYLAIQRFYIGTSRQLKRLESVTRSPIYSHCQESVTGVSTIRAYRLQDRFIEQIEDKIDYSQMSYYPSICSNRWLAIRLEFLGNIIILFAVLFAVLQRNYHEVFGRIDAGLVGLSITYALQVTQSLNWLVRMTSELETNVVSVERTKEYSETPREAPPIIDGHRPPRVWPVEGKVQFERYSTRYREGLDLVLRQISCDIRGGEKVGIVGRTGAGKSSLTVALFRIIEAASGAILIDGEDIATYGLDDLRSRITIIPQDPVLFSGTLRINLDPFNAYSDDEVWQALQTAHLKTFVSGLDEGLEYAVSEGGENLSVGQRQLVCLARALLRKTKILVLDEATAAVDMETDDLIQKTIRTEFADSTVLTIAHRLNTILDYDRVMVLSAGEIIEFDSPNKLIEQGGVFHSLAKDAGLI